MRLLILVVVACLSIASRAGASFHFMQIEQIIGGVNGDTTKQAIQLRMRTSFQNLTAGTVIRVTDAAGLNPITILTIPSNVTGTATGARILIASPNFISGGTSPACVADFTMANLIPASYMAAGRLTFGQGAIVYWSVSWGGAGYTGSQTGDLTNDANGNFGPAFAGALPSTTLQALRFTGDATAASTSNSIQYAISAGAAVFNNNAGAAFTVVAPPPPPCPADFNGDGFRNPDDLADFITCFFLDVQFPGFCAEADFNQDDFRDPDDLADFITVFFLSTC